MGRSDTLFSLAVCLTWYASSAILSPIGNSGFLREYNDVLAHILVRFAGAALIGLSVNFCDPKGFPLRQLPSLARQLVTPALCMIVANYGNSAAVAASGVAFAHIVKASGPFWTVLMCSILKSETYSIPIYLSLVPTVGGVALASSSDVSFTWTGLVAALVSVVAQTTMAVLGKDRIKAAGIGGRRAFTVMATTCTLFVLPWQVISSVSAGPAASASPFAKFAEMETWNPLRLFGLAAIGFTSEYVLQFAFVSLVNPLTFSVADIGRRVAVIAMATVVFDKQLDRNGVAGIAVAVFGICCYTALNNKRTAAKKMQ